MLSTTQYAKRAAGETMTSRKAALGELETLVILAVLRLEDQASVRRIREEIGERGGRRLSRGATYATVSRLERKGLLTLHVKQAVSGGRADHRFEVTSQGLETLRTAQAHFDCMRAGLESILDAP
jgi:DNA-binding PadR family transcriptional regulator